MSDLRMDMELQFPGDSRDARVRSRRNMSEVERWGSVAAGTALTLYGLSRRRPGGVVLAIFGGLLIRRGARGQCDIYEALDLNTASTSSDTRRALSGKAGSHVEEAVTVNRPAAELYHFWRSLENLPSFMQHLESVEVISETLSRWRAKGPGGAIVQWNAEIINDVPNSLIAWRSLEGSDVTSAGSVHFDNAGDDRGTRIRVRLQYSPPGGKIGTAVMRLLGRDAATEIREDLRRFKQLADAGEVANDRGSGTNAEPRFRRDDRVR
jgi:uncharacterized membrane protein